ncbi:pyridoxamine 5'-phosphate oxidase family protein [Kitasatospora sp. NPDC093806]|uniref:pyridoxamine 5'-phosphate oxidase family protein n=1 Tax=Kitasatospora sp. NPDC093806 TaxID=3155075 RepID=UPI0034126529
MNADPEAASEAASVQVEPLFRPQPGGLPLGVRALDEARALELLGGTGVGRVIYTVGALPAVLPVRFRLDRDGGVLLSAAAGSELARAVDGAVIAFEADEVDGADGTGWCVTVLGRAELRTVDGPDRPDTGLVEIRIGPELVVGRRLTVEAH